MVQESLKFFLVSTAWQKQMQKCFGGLPPKSEMPRHCTDKAPLALHSNSKFENIREKEHMSESGHMNSRSTSPSTSGTRTT